MQNLLHDLTVLLQQDDRLVADGKLLKNKIVELSLNLDPHLIRLLSSNKNIQAHFFQEVDDAWVFDTIKFQKFVSGKSFSRNHGTSPKSEIGLQDNDAGVSEAKEVVLNWPHKDCVLEGGQSKDDAKREEVFWNETMSRDDIEQLLAPKVFTNFKRYRSGGHEPLSTLAPHDNLIIRGNNLLVLHSLKKRFRGRINVIYLDPPYNTESDSFHYNDNFNRSTWLTFIKNRLDVAKDLLSHDGFLFLHISFHQFAYLKVLADEVFHGNHVCTFNLLVRHPDRILKGDKDFHDVVEYLLVYTKDKTTNKIAKRVEPTSIDDYIYQIEELNEGHAVEINGQAVRYFKPGDYRIVKEAPTTDCLQKISIRGSLKEGNSSGRFYEKYLAPIKSQFPPYTLFKIPDVGNDKFDHRYFYTPEEGNSNGGYFQGVPVDQREFREKPYANFLDFVKDFNSVGYEGGVEFRNGKKPESLLKLVFELSKVKKGDIVLDFFLGSGTTAAVAHKMGFQYIGIEQMDFGENDSVKRLAAVIEGEGKGISEAVHWKGGGSFVYCELAKTNSAIIDRVHRAENEKDVSEILDRIRQNGFAADTVKAASEAMFSGLSLAEKKKFLTDALERDQSYLHYSEIEDKDFFISDILRSLNHDFYRSTT